MTVMLDVLPNPDDIPGAPIVEADEVNRATLAALGEEINTLVAMKADINARLKVVRHAKAQYASIVHILDSRPRPEYILLDDEGDDDPVPSASAARRARVEKHRATAPDGSTVVTGSTEALLVDYLRDDPTGERMQTFKDDGVPTAAEHANELFGEPEIEDPLGLLDDIDHANEAAANAAFEEHLNDAMTAEDRGRDEAYNPADG